MLLTVCVVVETVVVPREKVPVLPIVIMPGLIVRLTVVSAALVCCIVYRVATHISVVMIAIDPITNCLCVMFQTKGIKKNFLLLTLTFLFFLSNIV